MPALPRACTALVAAGVLGLAACSAPSSPAPSSAPAVPSASASASAPSPVGGPAASGSHNDADVTFATSTVPHHQQAVEMSDLLLSKDSVDPDVSELATTSKAEQEPEIEQMTGWLQGWGAPASSPGGMGGMGGMADQDGMMSAADLQALAAATGKDAQTRYLRGMVRHHEGAVAMANTELQHGRNLEAKSLAISIVTSQQAEIDRMNQLLAR